MPQQLPKELINLIESLDEDQLHALNHLVVEQLRLVHHARTLNAMRSFHVMDRVWFTHNEKYYEGTITRLNQKTVSITLDDGNRWNVSPGVLTKIDTENPLKEL
ncbi:MAG TPA: hypothetical protein VN207_10590 [Ktedonobacteraceae bacterium]|nr:hypothetical protein [Ktedonobacteraceae bacterium]